MARMKKRASGKFYLKLLYTRYSLATIVVFYTRRSLGVYTTNSAINTRDTNVQGITYTAFICYMGHSKSLIFYSTCTN